MKPGIGLVVMNMGGPERLDDIEEFLHRVFMDPKLVRLPGFEFSRPLFAKFVASRRASRVRERYQMIGGGSPLLGETRRLVSNLAKKVPVPVSIAMRYSDPRSGQAADELRKAGVNKVVALPLFPQFSTGTTGSSIEDMEACLGDDLEMIYVQHHHDHPGFIAAVVEKLRSSMAMLEARASAHVLFTAHSVPLSFTRDGDPYVSQVEETARAVAQAAGLTLGWTLAYQSAAPMGSWHGPAVEDAVEELAEKGVTRLVVAPLSFVSENLETLFDLDICLKAFSQDMGMRQFIRMPTLSDSDTYAAALAELSADAATQVWGKAW